MISARRDIRVMPRSLHRRNPLPIAVLLTALLLAASAFAHAQDPTSTTPRDPAKNPSTAAEASAPLTPLQVRQAQYVADTTKLLQLAQELKAEVDKSSKDTLSLGVVKKAAEVEKLAKSLKERMRQN